jgi:hypothetical protein
VTRPRNYRATLVVDIGGQTTDIAIIEGGRVIDLDRSASISLGVLEAKRLSHDKLRAWFGNGNCFFFRWAEMPSGLARSVSLTRSGTSRPRRRR